MLGWPLCTSLVRFSTSVQPINVLFVKYTELFPLQDPVQGWIKHLQYVAIVCLAVLWPLKRVVGTVGNRFKEERKMPRDST